MRKALYWGGTVLLLLLLLMRVAVNFGPVILIDLIASKHWFTIKAFEAAFSTWAEAVHAKLGLSLTAVHWLYFYNFVSNVALLLAAVLVLLRTRHCLAVLQTVLGVLVAVALAGSIVLGDTPALGWIPCYLLVIGVFALPGARAYLQSRASPEPVA